MQLPKALLYADIVLLNRREILIVNLVLRCRKVLRNFATSLSKLENMTDLYHR